MLSLPSSKCTTCILLCLKIEETLNLFITRYIFSLHLVTTGLSFGPYLKRIKCGKCNEDVDLVHSYIYISPGALPLSWTCNAAFITAECVCATSLSASWQPAVVTYWQAAP